MESKLKAEGYAQSAANKEGVCYTIVRVRNGQWMVERAGFVDSTAYQYFEREDFVPQFVNKYKDAHGHEVGTCVVCGVKDVGVYDHGCLGNYSAPPGIHDSPWNKERQLIPLVGGWKNHTYYLVEVALFPSNLVHRAILGVGFVGINAPVGEPGNYSEVWGTNYDSPQDVRTSWYVRAIRELCTID